MDVCHPNRHKWQATDAESKANVMQIVECLILFHKDSGNSDENATGT